MTMRCNEILLFLFATESRYSRRWRTFLLNTKHVSTILFNVYQFFNIFHAIITEYRIPYNTQLIYAANQRQQGIIFVHILNMHSMQKANCLNLTQYSIRNSNRFIFVLSATYCVWKCRYDVASVTKSCWISATASIKNSSKLEFQTIFEC